MTELGDRIGRWCQEEALSVSIERDDEQALVCSVTLPGEPPLSVGAQAGGPPPRRLLLMHAFELPVPAEMVTDAEGPQRISMLLQRVAASRSGLVECSPIVRAGGPAAEVVVTLHEDGISKQGFLTALAEVRKIVQVIGWELEGMAASADMMSEVQAIMEQTSSFAAEVVQATQDVEPPAVAEAQPTPQAAAPSPAPQAQAPPATAAPAGIFCPNCGKQARPGARFCSGCGGSLEA